MRKVPKVVSPDEAVSVIQSGDSLYLSGFANSPELLVEALCRRGDRGELRDVRIIQLMTFGKASYTEERYAGIFIPNAFFAGANNRQSMREGISDYLPVGLSDTQQLYRSGTFRCDVALIKVTTPDEHGYVSLGVSVDITLAAVETAKIVIAVVDEKAPRTLGDSLIPYSSIDFAVMDNHPLMEIINPPPTELDIAIGRNCASLIDNGACLQMGIGSIPNAILSALKDHADLGINTEMFSDNVIPLVEEGIINGVRKQIDRGKLVTSFMMGSQRFYDFIDNNPLVLMKDIGYTNDPFIIAQNDNVVAINSALEIDLTGQVCADSIGPYMYSGVGGQLDFIYGASRSKGGKAIIAIASETGRGESKITPFLKQGAGVVTPRHLVHYVVTEYGIVNLYGKTLQERAALLISIAHPRHREALEKAAFERFGAGFLRRQAALRRSSTAS